MSEVQLWHSPLAKFHRQEPPQSNGATTELGTYFAKGPKIYHLFFPKVGHLVPQIDAGFALSTLHSRRGNTGIRRYSSPSFRAALYCLRGENCLPSSAASYGAKRPKNAKPQHYCRE